MGFLRRGGDEVDEFGRVDGFDRVDAVWRMMNGQTGRAVKEMSEVKIEARHCQTWCVG